jgi:hypothetical protein
MARASDLLNANARLDPLMNFQWSAVLTYPKAGSLSMSDFIEEVTLPELKIENQGVFREGSRSYFSGTADTGTLNIKFYEDRRLRAYSFINKWFLTVRSRNGTYSPPTQYKGTAIISAYDNAGIEIGQWKVMGIFPLSTPPYPFSSGQSERVIASVDFSVDDIVFTGSTQ